jgi:photosynthetic reaction center cytochrome c subunit
MWKLSQRQFRKLVVAVSVVVMMGIVWIAILGIWLIHDIAYVYNYDKFNEITAGLTSVEDYEALWAETGFHPLLLEARWAAPYAPAQNLTRITQTPPNVPEGETLPDGREAWYGEDNWTEGVQAGSEYIAQSPQPQNMLVLTELDTAETWAYMQQQVSGAMAVGCQYCHDINPDEDGNYLFQEDTFDQKIAARDMMRLVNDLNAQYIVNLPYWRGNYVTCATCHSGLGNGRGTPTNMEGVTDEFLKSVPPQRVNLDPLDENGVPLITPEEKPEEVRGRMLLQDATLWLKYNYSVWHPYDPIDPKSGRGSLAMVWPFEKPRTIDQGTIQTNVMNANGWALGVGCTYCHDPRNFYNYEIVSEADPLNGEYISPRLKAQRMLLMMTFMAENWDDYGAIAKDVTPEELSNPGPNAAVLDSFFGGGAGQWDPPSENIGELAWPSRPNDLPRVGYLSGRRHYRAINGEVYNMPGCVTCHARQGIPRVVVHEDELTETVLPSQLRGVQ